MDDRFLFRMYNKELKYYTGSNKHNAFDTYGLGSPMLRTHDDNFIIEQCTGLEGENGNLIFEGDVVLRNGSNGVVKYNNHYEAGACFIVDFGEDENAQEMWDYKLRWYELEIIGNIHEGEYNE